MTRKKFYDAIVDAGFPVVTNNGRHGFKVRLVDDWDDIATSWLKRMTTRDPDRLHVCVSFASPSSPEW